MLQKHIRSFVMSGIFLICSLTLMVGEGVAASQCSSLDMGCVMRVGGALLSMNGLNDWTAVYKLQILHLYQKINPGATYDDLNRLKAFIDAEFVKYKGQGSLDYQTIIQIANDIKNQTNPPIPGATQLVLELERSIDSIVSESTTTIENYRKGFAAWAASQTEYANNVLLEVDSYCKDNGELCNNLNAISGPMLGVAMGRSTPADVIKSLPVIKDDPLLGPIASAVDSSGKWTLDTAGTINLLANVYSNLSDMNTKNINFIAGTADSVDSHQENEYNDTIDYEGSNPITNNMLYLEKLDDEAEGIASAAEDKKTLDTARTAVSVVSMVVGSVIGDTELAEQISTYGGAAIKIASAISGLMSASSDMGSGDDGGGGAFGIGASVVSGNYIGAAMQVFSLFGGGHGPSVNSQILSQISALRTDIANLNRQMNTRFDRIDTQLNVILKTLNTRFDQIDEALANNTLLLNEIKSELSALQQQQSKMEMRIMASLQDVQVAELNAKINSAFNYSGAMPYATWNDINGWFYTYNRTTASNSTFSNQASPSIVDSELYSWLNSDAIDANINKLAKYPYLKWPQSFPQSFMPSSGNIPNPVIWAKSAEAFLEFSKLQPWYAALDDNNSSQWMSNIIAEGQKIKRVATAINHNENGLVDKLIRPSGNSAHGLYDSKGKQIFDVIAAQELSYNPNSPVDYKISKIDLWNPLNTTLMPNYPDASSAGKISTAQGDMPNSSVIINGFNLPESIKLSQVVNKNKIKISVVDGYCNSTISSASGWTVTEWDVHFILQLDYSGVGIAKVNMNFAHGNSLYDAYGCDGLNALLNTYGPYFDQTQYSFSFGDGDVVIDIVPKFSELTFMPDYNRVATVDAINDTKQFFASQQASFYSKVFNSLSSAVDDGGTPNANLFNELTGAKLLLQSYLPLGFDRSLMQNDYLKYLTYGEKGIFDGAAISSAIQDQISTLTNTRLPLPPLDLATPFFKRSDALAGELNSIVSSIKAGTFKEFGASVDATLDKLGMRINTLKTLGANDSYTVAPGSTLAVPAPGILDNDVHQNGVTLKAIIQSQPTHGALTVNTAGDGTFDGSFTYQPQAGYIGTDSFSYIVQGSRPVDGFSAVSDPSRPAVVTIKVSKTVPAVAGLAPRYLFTQAGSQQILAATYSYADGAMNLASSEILVATSSGNYANSIRAKYNRAAGTIALYEDAGLSTSATTCLPGAAGFLQNSQATLDCSKTSVTLVGNDLTVKWAITPKPAYSNAGAYTVWLKTDDSANNTSGFVNAGSWEINASGNTSISIAVNGNGGSVTQPIIGASSASFSVSTLTGYMVVSVTDNGTDVSSMLSGGIFTISDLTTSHAILVSFAPDHHTLSVTIHGSGSGSVHSDVAGISCIAGTCSADYPAGAYIILSPTATSGSAFAGWSGRCTGTGACGVKMDSDLSATATFNTANLLKLVGGSKLYGSVLTAYGDVSTVGTILARSGVLPGNVNLGTGKTVTIKGGYDSAFGTQSGYTTIQGVLTIERGRLNADHLRIQ